MQHWDGKLTYILLFAAVKGKLHLKSSTHSKGMQFRWLACFSMCESTAVYMVKAQARDCAYAHEPLGPSGHQEGAYAEWCLLIDSWRKVQLKQLTNLIAVYQFIIIHRR